MDTDKLAADANKAAIYSVLRAVEDGIKALRPDTSATAPEHVTGYEAGFRAAKRAMLDMLAD